MRLTNIITGGVLLLGIISCEPRWEEHYQVESETVNMNLWEAVQLDPNLSLYAQYMKEFNYDTLFQTDNPYTLFIPDNDAFTLLTDTGTVTRALLDYHISLHFIQSRHISGKKKIQTLAEKFALFENANGGLYFDGIELQTESPLYLNGKYYVMGQAAIPRPNIYEYFSVENPILTDYIDSYDTIILDKELSRPIGFDEFGNTIYDTVSQVFNIWEDEFFPVSEEFRAKTATLVFPGEDDYNAALTEMAEVLGDLYVDYRDIPLGWQYDVLIPYLLERQVFENMVEPEEFIPPPLPRKLKMKNILGDSVYIKYMPKDKFLCSNGYAYNYTDFAVPDTLFNGPTRIEGESLVRPIGINKYAWRPEVKVASGLSFTPIREYSSTSSNDSIVRVSFTKGYSQNFSLQLKIKTLFPRRYLMVVRTHMFVGGIYDIYVNDELVMNIDYYDYVLNRELWYSVTGVRYRPEGTYNRFDCWVDNKNEYGNTTLKFVYVGPGKVASNGLIIDYIDFVPYDN